jgi:hypothetical protein
MAVPYESIISRECNPDARHTDPRFQHLGQPIDGFLVEPVWKRGSQRDERRIARQFSDGEPTDARPRSRRRTIPSSASTKNESIAR